MNCNAARTAVTRGNSRRYRCGTLASFAQTLREHALARREPLAHLTARHKAFKLALQFARIELGEHTPAGALARELANQPLAHEPRSRVPYHRLPGAQRRLLAMPVFAGAAKVCHAYFRGPDAVVREWEVHGDENGAT
ncbi:MULTISPECIES: hypothetical protein [unclassified Burkholderia]|uniref:hypothetical protein n=1 Tax=unclassified Burkholderia TaxID=2613784 RepID=UPI0021AB59B2|nr:MULTISPECIES: hypothetical protein [unclassified Burkholderia]